MYLASVSSRLLLHDVNSWEVKKSYACNDGLVRDISWSDDGKYLLQVNAKGLIEILNTSEPEVRSLQHVPLRETWSATFHRDGHRNVAIGTKSGNVLIWDTKMKTITKSFPSPAHQAPVNILSFNAKNTNLAASMLTGETIIYGCATNIPVLTVNLLFSKSISAMKFHHESRAMLGLATDEGHLAVRDVTTNKDKVLFENAHAAPITDFAYSAINKDVMISCGLDKMMHIYDIKLNHVVSTIRTSQALSTLTINSENVVSLGTKHGSVLIYDLRDLKNPLHVLKDHSDCVRRVTFQPNKKKSATPGENSVREDSEVWSPIGNSPTKNVSDLFMMGDSPVKSSSMNPLYEDSKKNDTFLMMMGLDNSNNNSHSLVGEGVNKNELLYKQFDAEKNQSTPINTRSVENHTPVISLNGNMLSTTSKGLSRIRNSITNQRAPDEETSLEEMKEFMRQTLGDVADENRQNFLRIMLSLSKQQVFLEKQLSGMNNQIQDLLRDQGALMESNRRLVLEIEQLKANVM